MFEPHAVRSAVVGLSGSMKENIARTPAPFACASAANLPYAALYFSASFTVREEKTTTTVDSSGSDAVPNVLSVPE